MVCQSEAETEQSFGLKAIYLHFLKTELKSGLGGTLI